MNGNETRIRAETISPWCLLVSGAGYSDLYFEKGASTAVRKVRGMASDRGDARPPGLVRGLLERTPAQGMKERKP